MTIILEGTIKNSMLNQLVTSYNKLTDNEGLTIYFNSTGGETLIAEAMIEFINDHHENITLIGYSALQSAAFSLFFDVICYKKIVKFTIGMAHLAYSDVRLNEMNKTYYDDDKFYHNELVKYSDDSMKIYKNYGISKVGLKKIKEGGDYYMDYKELNRLLEKQLEDIVFYVDKRKG